jgi:hypothetical protein
MAHLNEKSGWTTGFRFCGAEPMAPNQTKPGEKTGGGVLLCESLKWD